jgi:hypothetical protein
VPPIHRGETGFVALMQALSRHLNKNQFSYASLFTKL